jgi:acyl-coenzyme A synthetase/AMP-(fatty) acid ligase
MDREDMLLGAVGRPAPGSVAIVDEERRPVPPGQAGEIAFSRAVFPVRYWGEAGQAGAALERLGASADEAGWYHSGDRGRFDEEGRLYVLGRVAHQINRGGLKIDPVEVESALRRCPDVADAAVIGLPNAVVGETVCACVVPKPGTSPELEPLRSLLGQVLATYKLPEELAVREDLPRTQVGKLDLERLRTEVMAGARQRRAG